MFVVDAVSNATTVVLTKTQASSSTSSESASVTTTELPGAHDFTAI